MYTSTKEASFEDLRLFRRLQTRVGLKMRIRRMLGLRMPLLLLSLVSLGAVVLYAFGSHPGIIVHMISKRETESHQHTAVPSQAHSENSVKFGLQEVSETDQAKNRYGSSGDRQAFQQVAPQGISDDKQASRLATLQDTFGDKQAFQQVPQVASGGTADKQTLQQVPSGGKPKGNRDVVNVTGSVCITGEEMGPVVVSCRMQPLGPRFLPPETSVIETTTLPPLLNLLPEIGNGHIATVVRSNSIFMNGLYNGADVRSHRARIPSTAAVMVSVVYPGHGVTTKYRLDLGRGVFSEVYTGKGFTVEVRRYAHRGLSRLLVTEVVLNRTTSTLPITLSFDIDAGDQSKDIDFVAEKPGIWNGRTKTAEYPQLNGTTSVTVVFSIVPPLLTFAPSTQGTVAFITSVSHDRLEAMQYYKEGKVRLRQGTLFSSHADEWEALWQRGRVDVTGNITMALTTNAALYYLLTALPLQADSTWPFVGMAPGGLAHGDGSKDYMGHVFWDQDTWMFPPVALLHADLGRLIVGTRLRTHSAAVIFANVTGFKGARYPWESAYTGLNTSPSKATTEYELHVTGDVSLMMRQYLQLTNDMQFLKEDGGYKAIADIANFWVSKSVYSQKKRKFEILDVMGPDEYNWPVNNSVYTNVIAILSMRTAQYAANLTGQAPQPQWAQVASTMFVEYDVKLQYHPEYEQYIKGTKVKQADVILLGFPLKWSVTERVHQNDLTYYANVTPGGPAMTWSVFAVNWLRLAQEDKAHTDFYKGTWNVQDPFKVWSENADGRGAYNFHTGMGGYLQSLLYGYLGADLNDDHLGLDPQLPPSLTALAVRGLDYRGSSLDVAFNAAYMNITLTKLGSPLTLKLVATEEKIPLHLGATVTTMRQPASFLPLSA